MEIMLNNVILKVFKLVVWRKKKKSQLFSWRFSRCTQLRLANLSSSGFIITNSQKKLQIWYQASLVDPGAGARVVPLSHPIWCQIFPFSCSFLEKTGQNNKLTSLPLSLVSLPLQNPGSVAVLSSLKMLVCDEIETVYNSNVNFFRFFLLKNKIHELYSLYL